MVTTRASSATSATAMSDGPTAKQPFRTLPTSEDVSVRRAAPNIEWYRLSPARALQNLPPLRKQTMGPPNW